MDSLVSLIRYRAVADTQRIAYTFLDDTGSIADEISYIELDRRVRLWARHLQESYLPGSRVLLLLQPGLPFLLGFLACLYSGLIAIPAYPPSRAARARSSQRFMAIANDSQASVALTTKNVIDAQSLETNTMWLNHTIDWIDIDTIDANPDDWIHTNISSQDIAFLQYTSGSTATPKGVKVSHRNIMHNEEQIKIGFDHSQDDVIVGWLPLFHDMGLIGNLLQPLYVGGHAVLMSPAYFLSNPYKWLLAISDYQGTTSGGPNFAYQLCVDRISEDEKKTLDLSSWRTAFNGSEPVRASTLESFASAFSSCGFRKSAFSPCYGLAESTLLTTIRDKQQELIIQTFSAVDLQANRAVATCATHNEKDNMTLVSSGRSPQSSQSVIIVSTSTYLGCDEGQVGEIWIDGESVALGDWADRDPESFQGCLADNPEKYFLRTGDLGFMWKGELFVTGRLKDLIIINGRNIYPQDIEEAVENCYSGLCSGGGAAFSVNINRDGQDIGEERLVVVQEIDKYKNCDLDKLMRQMSEVISTTFTLQAEEIVLIRRRSLPKTTSGKVQRKATKQAYLVNELHVIARYHRDSAIDLSVFEPTSHQPTVQGQKNDVIYQLQQLVASGLRLPVEVIDIHKSPVALGMDSLLCATLRSELFSIYRVDVELEIFFDDLSIHDIAMEIFTRLNKSNELSSVDLPNSNLSVNHPEIPLSWAQLGIWLADQMGSASSAFNLPFAIELEGVLDTRHFCNSLITVVNRYSVFCTVFRERNGIPVQTMTDWGELAIPLIDLSCVNVERQKQLLHDLCLSEAKRAFDLSCGPLFTFYLFCLDHKKHVLFVNLHHIIADGWSIGIMLEDLAKIYSASGTEQPRLRQLPYEYKDYSIWQRQKDIGMQTANLLDFWKKQLSPAPTSLVFPDALPTLSKERYSGETFEAFLSEDLAQGVATLCRQKNITQYVFMLAILKVLLYKKTGEVDIIVGTGTLGRDIAGSECLVGNFINMLAMRTDCSQNPTFQEFIRRVRETCLNAFSHQGLPYELLMSQVKVPRVSTRSPLFQVTFGTQNEPRVDAKFKDLNVKRYLLPAVSVSRYDLSLWVSEVDEGLRANWSYSTDLFDRQFIESMHLDFQNLTQAVITNFEIRLDSLKTKGCVRTVNNMNVADTPKLRRSTRQSITITETFDNG